MFTFPIVATFRISLNNHQILIVVLLGCRYSWQMLFEVIKKLAVENNEQYRTATTTNQ